MKQDYPISHIFWALEPTGFYSWGSPASLRKLTEIESRKLFYENHKWDIRGFYNLRFHYDGDKIALFQEKPIAFNPDQILIAKRFSHWVPRRKLAVWRINLAGFRKLISFFS